MALPKTLITLKERNFVLLWLGQTISSLGDRCHEIALTWLALSLTSSAFFISTILTVSYIPTILLLIIGGAWADRANPQRIMIWSDVLRAFVTLILAILVTLGYINIIAILIFAFFYGIVKAFFNPAVGVLFPTTISSEQYNAAISFQRMSMEVVSLVGPPLGGALIARYNIGAAFLFDAASFVLSAGAVRWMRLKKSSWNSSSSSKKGLDFAELTAGFQFVWQEKGMLAFILFFAFTNALNDAEAVLVPILARSTLRLSAIQFGLLGTFASAGVLSSAFLMNLVGDRIRHRSFVICGGMALFGFTIINMGIATEAWHLYIAYFIFGLTFVVPDVVSSTLWLAVIPEHLRGRVFALLGAIAMSLNPVGFLLAGLLGSVYGVRAGLWIGGGAIALLCAVVIIYPPARNLDNHTSKNIAES